MPVQKPGRSRQNYGTPDDFIVASKWLIDIETYTFDFAADSRNTKARRYWGRHDDSLSKSRIQWRRAVGDGWGYLNPEFGDIGPWAERCAQLKEDGGRVGFLVPASIGANWFQDHVFERALVIALNGRLAFIKGKPNDLYPKDCMFCVYSPDVPAGFAVWKWKSLGAVNYLRLPMIPSIVQRDTIEGQKTGT